MEAWGPSLFFLPVAGFLRPETLPLSFCDSKIPVVNIYYHFKHMHDGLVGYDMVKLELYLPDSFPE